ncbi:MAG: gliding motility associated protein GldN [Paraglaciecola sp.]|jgi:gliding motility associated protien GldN
MVTIKKSNPKLILLSLFVLAMCQISFAQTPDDINMGTLGNNDPLDGLVERSSRRILPYEHVREADIMWEKRIWRVIDIREKMNLPFGYPERPFFSILMDATTDGSLTAYSTEDDKFTSPLTPEEVASMGATVDTVITFDPETYEEQIQVVRNDLNPEDVKRFRMKEIWFFDEETSTMQVRILGLAPLIDVKDENGNFRYEKPMFWIYYPEARATLAEERVFNPGNDASPNTWEDLLEMRFFASYIYKESNVLNRRLQDYLSGVDLLLEADKIKQSIFNYEHDLWSY